MPDREITVSAKIEIPTAPEKIYLAGGAGVLPLTAFDMEALREIGEEWTKNLIEKAKEQAKEVPL